jgi:hypothetical protein
MSEDICVSHWTLLCIVKRLKGVRHWILNDFLLSANDCDFLLSAKWLDTFSQTDKLPKFNGCTPATLRAIFSEYSRLVCAPGDLRISCNAPERAVFASQVDSGLSESGAEHSSAREASLPSLFALGLAHSETHPSRGWVVCHLSELHNQAPVIH